MVQEDQCPPQLITTQYPSLFWGKENVNNKWQDLGCGCQFQLTDLGGDMSGSWAEQVVEANITLQCI